MPDRQYVTYQRRGCLFTSAGSRCSVPLRSRGRWHSCTAPLRFVVEIVWIPVLPGYLLLLAYVHELGREHHHRDDGQPPRGRHHRDEGPRDYRLPPGGTLI